MELRHLRYFVTVAEEGNFTRAALRLHMQQPPLSQQIRALEDELGFALFRRHPKGVDLSPAGKIYLQEARAILDKVTRAGALAASAASGMYSALIDACMAAGYTPRIAAEVDNMLTNISLVAAGVGISVTPASMQGFHTHAVKYCRIADDGASLHAPLTLVAREDNITPAVAYFIDEAKRLAVTPDD